MAESSKKSEREDDDERDDAEGEGEGVGEAASPEPAKGLAQRKRRAAPPPPRRGTLGTSMVLFVIVVGGLAAGFAILGKEQGGTGPAAPKWRTGQEVDVELTLVSTDKGDLACAATTEVEGKHCAFETQTKTWAKPDEGDADKKLLKPYTTTDGVQFTAAGVWSEPALASNLPATRFAVKCKYKVEGKLMKPSIRWNSDGPWYPQTSEWYAGSVSGCTIAPSK